MTGLRHRALAAMLSLSVATSACIGGSGPDIGSLVVTAVSGAARVLAADADWAPLASGRRLAPGDVVEVGAGGEIEVARGADSSVAVRPARDVNAEITVGSVSELDVAAGEVLVTSAPAAPIGLTSEGVSARGDGVYRFDRALSIRIGVYEGSAVVATPSGELRVPEYRQSVIAGRVLPRSPEPLRVRTGDAWDARFLSEVIDLDRRLSAQRRGYQAEFGRRMRTLNPLREIAGDDRRLRFLRSELGDRTSGDLMIALVIGLLVEDETGSNLSMILSRIFGLFDAGASWGLIAVDEGIESRALTDGIVRAIALRTGDVEPGTDVTPPPASPSPSPGGPSPSPEPTKTKEPSPSPSPTPSESPSPSPSPSPTPTPTPTPPLCEISPELCDPL